jgi:hypothetical protein
MTRALNKNVGTNYSAALQKDHKAPSFPIPVKKRSIALFAKYPADGGINPPSIEIGVIIPIHLLVVFQHMLWPLLCTPQYILHGFLSLSPNQMFLDPQT